MTASWFRQTFLVADQALDTIFGETITVTPMVKPSNGRPGPDPNRAVTTVQGIFDEPSIQDFPAARGHAAASSHEFGTTKPQVEFTTDDVPYRIVIGDRITRENGDRFEVADPGEDGFGRTVLKLTDKLKA